MKKTKLISLCIMLSATLLIGCGTNTDNTNTTNTNTANTTATNTNTTNTTATNTTVAETPQTLSQLFASHDLKVGTCLSPAMLDNPNTEKIVSEQFSSITPENALKPDFILNHSKSKEIGELAVELNPDVIKMLDWAKANDKAVRGHTLLWYMQTPDWIFYEDFDSSKSFVTRDVMLERMEGYIKSVFDTLTQAGYIDLFYAYDVVNEAWMEDGTLRDNNWSQVIGEDYLYYAFYYAQKYAPENIDLYYNDYNEQYKYNKLIEFVNELKDENGNPLIDGIGLQAHLYTQDDLNKYFNAIDKISEAGIKVEITELDLALGAWQNTLDASDDNLKAQGKFYYNLINGILERKEANTIDIDSLTFWGFWDSLSWRAEASPLLYDASLSPKYAFYGAIQDKENAGF